MTIKYPDALLTLVAHLKKLPGVGRKTAERFGFHLLEWEEKELDELAPLISTLKARVQKCSQCGCLMDQIKCKFCEIEKRNPHFLCLIASAKEAYSIEETGSFDGFYHVLGSLLSPLDGITPEALNLPLLRERLEKLGTKELILALDSTLEGEATALFIKEQFETSELKVSRLAFGLPLGSSLDFVDEGTLSQALTGRQPI